MVAVIFGPAVTARVSGETVLTGEETTEKPEAANDPSAAVTSVAATAVNSAAVTMGTVHGHMIVISTVTDSSTAVWHILVAAAIYYHRSDSVNGVSAVAE